MMSIEAITPMLKVIPEMIGSQWSFSVMIEIKNGTAMNSSVNAIRIKP